MNTYDDSDIVISSPPTMCDDGREAPVIRCPDPDELVQRLDRYAWAARFIDDLPNRPLTQTATVSSAPTW